MPVVPQNLQVYLNAFVGAVAGFAASGNQPISLGAKVLFAQAADAFAQQVDTEFAIIGGEPSSVTLTSILTSSSAVWQTRSMLPTPDAVVPGNYTDIAIGIVAMAREADTQVTAEGIDPNTSMTGPLGALFGDGTDGDIVISAPNTATDGYRNAQSFTINPGGSIRVPTDAHFLLRARTKIVINGPINGSATLTSHLNSGVNISNIIGATVGGSGGGGGGGGGDPTHPNSGITGADGSNQPGFNGYGFSTPTPAAGGAGGAGAPPDGSPGGDGAAGAPGTLGTDVIDIGDHFKLYPAGPGGTLHGAVIGGPGANGGDGGAGSSGNGGAGGTGGQGVAIGGNGGSLLLLVAPEIIVNALISADGGAGTNAPNAGTLNGATAGTAAPLGSNLGGGGGGAGGGGSGGGAAGVVLLFYGRLFEAVTPTALPGAGGLGGTGATGGAGDGTGGPGGTGGKGGDGATGSPGFIVRQKIW